MRLPTLQTITSRPPMVIASLGILTVLAFAGVTRLVNRFNEQQKANARHLYQRGLAEQQAGKADLAIEHFRAALAYEHDNFDYQLQLARALRDTGKTDEAESYLISLWEREPQNGAINLALGRLAARQHSIDKILQYYHNAIYGVWPSDADQNRLNTWFELVDKLLAENARPQAQAELISMTAELHHRSDLELRIADLFAQAQDYRNAMSEYVKVLAERPDNAQALAGAGSAAFRLGDYREADHYLQRATKENSEDKQTAQFAELSKLILESDPFQPRLSDAERIRRIRAAFAQAGERLDNCAVAHNIDLKAQPPSNILAELDSRWKETKPKVEHLRATDSDFEKSAMDLVFQIEQAVQAQCGGANALDQALILLAQNQGAQL